MIAVALIAVCSAARLENTYLPPNGANGAGGGNGIPPPYRPGGGPGKKIVLKNSLLESSFPTNCRQHFIQSIQKLLQ